MQVFLTDEAVDRVRQIMSQRRKVWGGGRVGAVAGAVKRLVSNSTDQR